MYKPYGNKCIVRINKRYILDKDKKPVAFENGELAYEQEQEALVLESNIEGIKKGMRIICLTRGEVPIIKEETKKVVIAIIDAEDICAYVAK
jgi:hypothetical protein